MDPKEDYKRIQEEKVQRGGTDFRFPLIGELANNWEKTSIPLGQLMERKDLQIYIGKPEEWTSYLWQQTGTTSAVEIARHWETIVEYLPKTDELHQHISTLDADLAKLVVYNQTAGNDYPLFIVESSVMSPYVSGDIIDGNHRLITLLRQLRAGEIQEDAPIPIWRGTVPLPWLLLYNTLTFFRDRKPLHEKISLLKHRAKR